MEERETRTSNRSKNNKSQQRTVLVAVIAVVLLVIGGIAGSAMQKGSAKKAKAELEEARIEFAKELNIKDTQIDALKNEIAAKELLLEQAGAASSTAVDEETEPTDPVDTAPVTEPERTSSGSWFGKLMLVLIVIALIIAVISFAYNFFVKDKDDEDEEDDDEYDEDDEDDDEEEDEEE